MAQKFLKVQNKNSKSKSYGKWYARTVKDEHPTTTQEVADFIQAQCSVKGSDVKAVLDELGGALNHYLMLGKRVVLDNIGAFKVGFSSLPAATADDFTAANIKNTRVIFQPELKVLVVGQTVRKDGTVGLKRARVKKMLEGLLFEETTKNAVSATPADGGSASGN